MRVFRFFREKSDHFVVGFCFNVRLLMMGAILCYCQPTDVTYIRTVSSQLWSWAGAWYMIFGTLFIDEMYIWIAGRDVFLLFINCGQTAIRPSHGTQYGMMQGPDWAQRQLLRRSPMNDVRLISLYLLTEIINKNIR